MQFNGFGVKLVKDGDYAILEAEAGIVNIIKDKEINGD